MPPKSKNYRDLILWQKSMDLVIVVYRLVQTFPQAELYGLGSQMKRCSVSIPSNVAEGSKRGTRKDFRQFLLIAYGSGAELETQVEIAKRLSLGDKETHDDILKLLMEVMRMLNTLIKTLEKEKES